jgi:hypothetical protein
MIVQSFVRTASSSRTHSRSTLSAATPLRVIAPRCLWIAAARTPSPFSRVFARAIRSAMRPTACERLFCGNGIMTAEGGGEISPASSIWFNGVAVTVGSAIGTDRNAYEPNSPNEQQDGADHQSTADRTICAGRWNECRTGYADIPRTRQPQQASVCSLKS